MADDLKSIEVRNQVSEAEWKARVDLAALYRLVALEGWDDMIFTHISHRVPGPDAHFLINPYGMFFEEITASSLVKVDLDGNIVQETPYFINPAGFTIHSAIHAAREDAHVVMHLHTDDGVAVASQKEGLLPLSQTSMVVRHDLAYHDYEGIALDLGERERLVADMGAASNLLLRNHGTLTVGETAAECYLRMFFLERACTMQVRALSVGRD
ncbi:MAG: class II aldolase/adducin family protein, partial [Pseudomonadota bacterium]